MKKPKLHVRGEVKLWARNAPHFGSKNRPDEEVKGQMKKFVICYDDTVRKIQALVPLALDDDEVLLRPILIDGVSFNASESIITLVVIEANAAGFEASAACQSAHWNPDKLVPYAARVPVLLMEPLRLWAENPGLREIRLREYLEGLALDRAG